MSNLSDVMSQPVNIPRSIPDNWNWVQLTNVCRPKQWKTISSNELTETGYPVFGANGYVGFYPEYNHEEQTIAITCRGATCGTVNLIPAKTYITGNSMCLDNVKNNIDTKYLYYATTYRTLSDAISGSAQPQITGDSLKFVSFPSPPLPEQQKIASILTSVDDVIENTQSQINKLQDLKKGTMNELLTRGIGHTEFVDSLVGKIPKGWEVKVFEDVFEVQLGKMMNKKDRESKVNQYHFLANANVQWQRVVLHNLGTMEFSDTERKKFSLKEGDLLICEGGEIGRTAIWRGERKNCYYQKAIHRCRVRNGLKDVPLFFMYLMKYFVENRFLNNFVGQTSIAHLTKENLQKIPIVVPSVDEQIQITSILSSIDKNIEDKQRKLEQTNSLKKSLMQDLLTGKVRVPLQ